MDIEYIKERITTIDADLIVLKGFPVSVIEELENEYSIIDKYIFTQGKIDLDKINANQFLMDIMTMQGKSICCCESLIKLCSNISNIGVLGKRIGLLENNIFSLYPNPSISVIPDFESDEFEDGNSQSTIYSGFYSYAIKDNGTTLIQYIDNFSEFNQIKTTLLYEPIDCTFLETSVIDKEKVLTSSLLEKTILSLVNNQIKEKSLSYLINPKEIDLERIRLLKGICKVKEIVLDLYTFSEDNEITPREEFYEILNKIWGYSSFRPLQVYKDLSKGREIVDIAQNEIIETVVSECEKGLKGQVDEMHNILLTSPTGAGKSLLFQLSAIYMAEKYDVITIVVSPLVALMDDQVDGLVNYNGVATLNSNCSGSAKASILSRIKSGDISILYLSPELLLSYTISSFIGNRRLGLIVIDEAHTVTTWGRDFRVDYLFLGNYIRRAQKILGYNFPIFALTATAVWDPSGKNDMVFDTIRSLHMDPCMKFIGNVKRSNISFNFSLSGITTNYEQRRRALTICRIREAIERKKKTIVYFPFKKTINDIVFGEEVTDIRHLIASYHASLYQNIKTQNALDFKSGKKSVMCATKAYGMGIDVSDIEMVYHHAPTGNLSDYVQEIGRIARDPKIAGVACIDFCPGDFRYIRKLHGLSTLKHYQVREVLKKLMALFKMNGEKRNMLISASDFSYIFPLADMEGVDQNLKSCLLLIGNDLLNRLRFHSIIVRPKSMFSKCYLSFSPGESKAFYKAYRQYVKKETSTVFLLDADRLWQDLFSNLSFPKFKFKLMENKILTDYSYSIKTKITVELTQSLDKTYGEMENFFALANSFLHHMSSTHHRITIQEMKRELPKDWSSDKREQFVETFKLLYTTPGLLGEAIPAYCSIHTSQSTQLLSFQFLQAGYENVTMRYLSIFRENIRKEQFTEFVDIKNKITAICEFLNSFGLGNYQRQGGEEPMIFVRINNPAFLNSLVRSKNYENNILSGIYEKQAYAERVYSYFFTTPMSDDERWDFIESYFLGVPEEKLLNIPHNGD